ncbi:MAG: hypothetical protein SP1CHLAM54_14850 [Chlamydiia bacterium]|nr:hypothetical protein [Chlamydiia bacterium]MCH9616375.1 hypothetical protein [Chlamydiia bacterium]MCH9629639.1 hypothetical protein [Chlamydiia bacterium]
MRYALNENKRVHVFESDARKKYICPKCRGIVKPTEHSRLGLHYRHNLACDHAKREFIHLVVQERLFKEYPNLQIEYPMKKIGRIADLVDLENRVVFEIQCSPIKKKEVIARNRAYKKLGFTVRWILHDHWFNKHVLGDAEDYLRERGLFYSSMNEKGHGGIYTQRDFVKKKRRLFKAARFPANILIRPVGQPTLLKHRLKWYIEDKKKFYVLVKRLLYPKR